MTELELNPELLVSHKSTIALDFLRVPAGGYLMDVDKSGLLCTVTQVTYGRDIMADTVAAGHSQAFSPPEVSLSTLHVFSCILD